MSGVIKIETLSDSFGIIDVGEIYLDSDFFDRGYIKYFTVTPLNEGVGQYPVDYLFEI